MGPLGPLVLSWPRVLLSVAISSFIFALNKRHRWHLPEDRGRPEAVPIGSTSQAIALIPLQKRGILFDENGPGMWVDGSLTSSVPKFPRYGLSKTRQARIDVSHKSSVAGTG